VYNFPDRDCSAKASAGELHLDQDGLNRYKNEYIDPIVDLLKEFRDIRIIIAYGTRRPLGLPLCPGR
jgi:cellulose 1,4-beta-cellobiosidase